MDVGVVAHATGSAYVEFNHTKVRPRPNSQRSAYDVPPGPPSDQLSNPPLSLPQGHRSSMAAMPKRATPEKRLAGLLSSSTKVLAWALKPPSLCREVSLTRFLCTQLPTTCVGDMRCLWTSRTNRRGQRFQRRGAIEVRFFLRAVCDAWRTPGDQGREEG